MSHYTLSIIKPDGVRRNLTGQILAAIEEAGFPLLALSLVQLTTEQARLFYAVHKSRPFYNELVESMTSGPIVPFIVGGHFADYRNLMGATDPSKAAPGTLRAKFALSIGENTVHGSDSEENALIESQFFFARTQIIQR